MPAEVVWSPAARRDLLDIYVLIGLEQKRAADRYLDRILARTERLAQHPRLGVRRPDIRPEARILVERPYLVLYRTDPNDDQGPVRRVEIIRVVDGRRDLGALF